MMLDPGPFGCIGIGVPYGIAASLAFPDKPVVVGGLIVFAAGVLIGSA